MLTVHLTGEYLAGNGTSICSAADVTGFHRKVANWASSPVVFGVLQSAGKVLIVILISTPTSTYYSSLNLNIVPSLVV